MNSVSNLANQIMGRFDVDPEVKHHFSSGVYAKQMRFPKGYTALSHKHNYDHLSILSSGAVVVQTDNYAKTYHAPACITIEAGTNHAITALEDAVWFCIHATDVTDENEVDAVLIAKEGK